MIQRNVVLLVTKIIADACSNHMGDMRLIEQMIKLAAEAGVDYIKFQSFRAEDLNKNYPNYEEMYAKYKDLELSIQDHKIIMSLCVSMVLNLYSQPLPWKELKCLNVLVWIS